jgi:transposase
MVSRDKLDKQWQVFDFDALARKQANAQRRLRLLGLAHLKEGKSYVAVAQSLRVTRHAVMRWADWFATDGIERLLGIPQSGRPPRLGKVQQEAVRRAIEQAQEARGGGRIRGEEIRQLLHEQFAVDYSLNGVYHLLKRLGMSWISARAISPQADLPAQTAFKKNVRASGSVGRAAARRV